MIGLSFKTYGLMVTSCGSNRRPTTLEKRKHRFTHAPANEMIKLLVRAGCKKRTAAIISSEMLESCIVCPKSGVPLASRKISLKHVCEEFDEEIQANYTFVIIQTTKYCVLHVVDTVTSFSETSIASQRTTEEMTALIETIWICRQGCSKSFSADSEFIRGPMKRFLDLHGITLNERPVRRHNNRDSRA